MADESLKTFRTARTRKPCQRWACYKTIWPGQRYLRAALPPNSDMGNVGWWTMNICQACMSLEDLNRM